MTNSAKLSMSIFPFLETRFPDNYLKTSNCNLIAHVSLFLSLSLAHEGKYSVRAVAYTALISRKIEFEPPSPLTALILENSRWTQEVVSPKI